VCAEIQSGPESTPALSFSHSTTTVPSKRFGLDGRYTTIRVRYGADDAGWTRQRPSAVSGAVAVNARAVPLRKYSCAV